MTYISIYLLVGMVVAGLNFRKLLARLFTKEEISEVKKSEITELPSDLQNKLFTGLVMTFLISLLTIVFYPMFIAIKMAKKVKS